MSDDNLKKYIDDFFNELVLFDDYWNNHKYKGILKASIEMFLDKKNNYSALKVYEMFFMIYQINSKDRSYTEIDILNEANIPLDFIKLMNRYADLYDLDILVRSVDIFIMGLAIYSQNENYRSAFRGYVIRSPYEKYYRVEDEFSHEEFLYRWAIASLFADIARPFKFMTRYLKNKLNKEFNLILSGYGEDFPVDFSSFRKLDSIISNPDFKDSYQHIYHETKFLDLSKPTRILAHKIDLDFNIGLKGQNLLIDFIDNHMYGDCPNSENDIIDHGLLSSIILLNFYGYLINKYHKNPDFFYYPIVDSAGAILLHNFYVNVLMRDPFKLERLSAYDCPLAYLLILCNELVINGSFELDLIMDDDSFRIMYRIGDVALYNSNYIDGLKNYLNNALDLDEIFEKGLLISSELKVDGQISFKSKIRQRNIHIGNIESLAIGIHESNEKDREKMGLHPCRFWDLTSKDKMSTIKQAMHIYKTLNMIGCEVADIGDERQPHVLSDLEVEYLARYRQELVQEEKSATGELWGPAADSDAITNLILSPYSQLDEKVIESEIKSIQNIPNLLDECGLKIVLSRISLLANEIYGDEDTLFNNMMIENLIETLSDYGYELVDMNDSKEAIVSFRESEVKYIAKEYHGVWCSLKYVQGWKYGSHRDDEKRVSPAMVPWDILSEDFKEENIDFVLKIPKIVKDFGLKIVKSI